MKNPVLEKLQHIKFFNKLTSSEILFLSPYLEEKEFAKDEVILPQGSTGGDLYLIICGEVSVNIILPGDYKQDLAILGTGQVFGEVAFLADDPVTASVVAKEPCLCLVFYHKLLQMLRFAKPEIAFKIEEEITSQLAERICSNITGILELLNKIPAEFQLASEHALHLEKFSVESKTIVVNELDSARLEKSSYFKGLNQEQRSRLLPLLTVKKYDSGYRFLANGPNLKKIGLIYAGAVMFFSKENNQLKKSLAVLQIGDLFLQNFIFPEYRKIADYVTCENSIVIELEWDVYQKLRNEDPAMFYIISEYIHREIAGSVYVVNRQFVRISSEYKNLIAEV